MQPSVKPKRRVLIRVEVRQQWAAQRWTRLPVDIGLRKSRFEADPGTTFARMLSERALTPS